MGHAWAAGGVRLELGDPAVLHRFPGLAAGVVHAELGDLRPPANTRSVSPTRTLADVG